MKNSSKFYIATFLIAVITIAYFGYSTFKSRYQNETETEESIEIGNDAAENEIETENLLGDEDEEDADWDKEELTAEEELDEDDEEELIDEFLEVSAEDCEKECSTYKEDEDVKYCRQVCGLVDAGNPPADGACDALSGLERDYCLKDLAVKNKDLSQCGKITDKNVAKTCNNRIWEDILEGSPSL